MPQKKLKTLDVRTRKTWRAWLLRHHETETDVWLVFHKKHTSVGSLPYEDAVEEALCFGWIDSLIRRLDDDRYARKFTPRKPGSRWSTINRRRYAKVEKAGLLTAAGRARPPTERSGDAPDTKAWNEPPPYMAAALDANPRARAFFEGLPPSQRRHFVAWVDSAKKEETRQRRLREAIGLLAKERKLGLK